MEKKGRPGPSYLVVYVTWILLQHAFITAQADAPHVEMPRCNGWYNNAAHPNYGSTGMPLSRDLPPAYSDDTYQPSGQDRPNPRLVSRALVQHLSNTATDTGRTVLCVFFGQHVVDDIADVRNIACPAEYTNIALQPGDPLSSSAESDGVEKIMPFQRAVYKGGTGMSPNNPRQQVNAATAWLDGSAIYGVTEAWQDRLRSFANGSLQTSHGGRLPGMNVVGLPMYNPPSPKYQKTHQPGSLYALGNVRGNENPFLLAVSTVWHRWHNHWAHRFHSEHPEWTDEQVFQQAKRWVIATYQNTVLYEWLPAFINDTVDPYTGYNRFVDPSPSNVFTAAAMRYGHSMVPSAVFKRNSSGAALPIRTCNSYWNVEDVIQTPEDVDDLLSGMAGQLADGAEKIVSEDLQGFLYGPLTFSRRDLVAMDIQRGRDHGLPDYNTACREYGFTPLRDWADLRDINPKLTDEMLSELSTLYGTVDRLDVWVGGMLTGAGTGAPAKLFRTIIKQQFVRLRDADRFWFENSQTSAFTDDELNAIRGTTFKDILSHVTDVPPVQLQDEVFVWKNGNGSPLEVDPLDLEPCTGRTTFSYFDNLDWVTFGVTVIVLCLFPLGCVFVIMVAAWRNELRTEKRLQAPRKKPSLPPDAYQATEWQGRRAPTREVVVKLQSPSLIEVRDTRDTVVRLVNIAKIARGVILCSTDKGCKFLSIHIPREYDLVLKFPSHHERETFLAELKQFLTTQVPVELQEVELGQLQKQAVTIEDRQKILEDFFCSVFLQVQSLGVEALSSSRALDDWVVQPEKWKAKKALDCELTKVEFAEAMSLRPDSQFVVQMFNLVDKDKNGYISFREFLDLVVIFSKGTMEDKLRLMFDMYDVEGNGHLSKEQLINMLKSLMELVSNNTTGRIEDLVESMFAEAGMVGEQELSFDKFVLMMQDHRDELNQARLNIAGSDWTTRSPIRTSAAKETARRRSSSVLPKGPWRLRRASAPVVSSSDIAAVPHPKVAVQTNSTSSTTGAAETTAAENVTASDAQTAPQRKRRSTGRPSQDISVHLLREKYPDSAFQRKLQAFKRWVENKRLQILYLIFYFFITFALFAERAYHYAVEAEDFGIRQLTQYGIIVSRGAAASMSFSFSLLLLTMCRNSLTKLRETFLNRYIPFDDAVDFHKIVAITALVFTFLHTLGHLTNVYHFAVHPLNHLVCLFPALRGLDDGSDQPPKWYWWAFQTMAGVTGVLLLLVVSIIYVFATGYARRRAFSAFWTTHQLYIVLFILTVLHGSGRLIQNPNFHWYLIGPAIIFTLDKLVSISHRRQLVDVTRTELLPSGVTNIQFKRPVDFEYKSGQWVRVACPEQGPNEYHPMTLTSAPHEDTLSVHVRAVGPWTAQLRRTYDPENIATGTQQKIFLDGPFGEGHQDWYKYKIAVLVGGGIGITPFASILKDVAYLSSSGANMTCKKVYFLWVTRTQRHFEWFIDIIREVEEQDSRGLVAVHIFITQFFEKFDVRTTMLYIYERHFQRLSGRSLFTGLRATTHFGRPEFVSLLDSIQHQNPEVKKIGVFSCGPPGMTRSVEDACAQLNKKDLTHFVSYYENF